MGRKEREEWEEIGRRKAGLHIGHWPRVFGALAQEKLEDFRRFHALTRLGTSWYVAMFVAAAWLSALILRVSGGLMMFLPLGIAFVLTWAIFRWCERGATDLLGGISVLIGITIVLGLGSLFVLPVAVIADISKSGLSATLQYYGIAYLSAFAFVTLGTTLLSWLRNERPGSILKDSLKRVG